MSKKDDTANLFGFSKAEETIWDTLGYEAVTIAELTRQTALPRMTVYKIMLRFLDRGIAVRIKRDKRFRYLKADPSNIALRVNEKLGVKGGVTTLAISDAARIKAHRGIPAMLELIDKLSSEKQARWSLMQSSENAKLLIEKVAPSEVEKFNKKIAANKQITDLYIEEEHFEKIVTSYSDQERAVWLKSVERMAVVYILPKGTLTAKTDLMIQSKRVYLFDWTSEIIFEIQHRETVRMYQNFLNMLAASVPRTKNMYELVEEYKHKFLQGNEKNSPERESL